MHYAYILRSEKHPDKTYVGVTKDLEKRLYEHNSGESTYTKNLGPWKIEAYIAVKQKSTAEDLERYLKTGAGRTFISKRLVFH